MKIFMRSQVSVYDSRFLHKAAIDGSFAKASNLFSEFVGGFCNALELFFALKIKENGGFFHLTAL